MAQKRFQKARLDRLFRKLKGVDCVFLINEANRDPNFTYLTGFTSGVFEDSILVATRSGLHLITSPLEYQDAMAQRTPLMKVYNADGPDIIKRALGALIRGKRVGVNAIGLSYSTYERLKKKYKPEKMIDVSGAMIETRLVKDEGEIESIRDAAHITKKAMREIQKYFKAGVTELELAARFDFIQMSLGASGTSFDTIVSFGKNAALPHHSPDKTRLRKGELILIDAGAKDSNYCSDITRTFAFGKIGEGQKEMIDVVKEAQRMAIGAIRQGRDGREIHSLAENYLNETRGGKYKGRFIHALGHSVGLEVHDGPGFSKQKNILKPGMVITVEPGVYVPGFGGVRFEDDVLITEKGSEVL